MELLIFKLQVTLVHQMVAADLFCQSRGDNLCTELFEQLAHAATVPSNCNPNYFCGGATGSATLEEQVDADVGNDHRNGAGADFN